MNTEKPFRLHYGIHSGTLTSRDSESSNHATLEEAIAQVEKNEKDYAALGCQLWFATIYDDRLVDRMVWHKNGASYR